MTSSRFRILLVGTFASFAVWLPLSSEARAPSKTAQWVETFQSSPAAYGVNAPEKWAKEMSGRVTSVTGTLRFQFAASVGGSQIRIRFSNESGNRPLKIGAASVGLTIGFDGTATARIVPVTFGGAPGVTLPPGAPVLSDAITFPVKAGDQVLVSASLPEGIDLDSYGATGIWVAPGDQTLSLAMTGATMVIGRSVVSGVIVLADYKIPVLVTLGDSLTAGDRKSPDELHGWPEALSRLLNGDGRNQTLAVVNAAIAGNRLLRDGYGLNALARLDRDVLRINGVTEVIVLEGINDIGFQGRQQFGVTQSDIQLDDLIAAYRQIIVRVHAQGAKATGATLLPFEGAFYYTTAKEDMRQYVNKWIRTSGEYDAIVDLDAVMRDPVNAQRLRPEFDSGDHLHPNLQGQKAMAAAIILKR